MVSILIEGIYPKKQPHWEISVRIIIHSIYQLNELVEPLGDGTISEFVLTRKILIVHYNRYLKASGTMPAKYHKFSKNSASLIIRHVLHYNEIIFLKKFGTYNTLVEHF